MAGSSEKWDTAERVGTGLYRNVPGNYEMKLFLSAVRYFQVNTTGFRMQDSALPLTDIMKGCDEMKTDVKIARSDPMEPIGENRCGHVSDEERMLEPYGKYKAKVDTVSSER